MFSPDTRYSQAFVISTNDVDATGKASFQSICRYMQEMAAVHAQKLKLGFHDMIKENRAWVLAQMLIRMEQLPAFQETIRVKTWSNGPDGRFALRDFEISNANGDIIGRASSSWLVIDIKEKSICRLDNYFKDYKYEEIQYALDRKPGRVKPLNNNEIGGSLEVKFSDLDINGHVNNVRYIDFILDHFPYNFRMENQLYEIEMNFLKESKNGQEIQILHKEIKPESEYLHTLFNKSEERPSFSARTQWR